MAKKRTLIPYYGKMNQRLEKHGSDAMKAGRVDDANFYFNQSKKLYNARRGRIALPIPGGREEA